MTVHDFDAPVVHLDRREFRRLLMEAKGNVRKIELPQRLLAPPPPAERVGLLRSFFRGLMGIELRLCVAERVSEPNRRRK